MPRHVPTARDFHSFLEFNAPPVHLDLGPITEGLKLVPGLRTSAAFFTFLRANLVLLPPSTLNSQTSTPLLQPTPSSSHFLTPLFHTSLLATMSSATDDEVVPPPNPLDAIPSLNTQIITDPDEKVAALKLVADTIAQQRQFASRAIIFHPLVLGAYILCLALIYQFLWISSRDVGKALTTTAGVTMAFLVAIRSVTAGYIQLAEEFNWEFAKNEEGEEDLLLGTKFGDEVIGCVVLRLERSGNGKRKRQGGKGVIRGWAVRIRYRGKGVGTALLEEAVRVTREKLGNSAEVGFAAEHANSKLLLPDMFNGGFKKREAKAARSLEKVVEEVDGKKKR